MVFSERRIQAAFAETIVFFQSKRIKYLVVGALAVAFWGRTRATADLDFQLQIDGLHDLTPRLPASWIQDQHWATHNPMLRRRHLRVLVSGIPVDLMLPQDDFEKGIFAHGKRRKFWDRLVCLVSPEDLIVMKMKAGRPHDFDDAASVIELQRSLDRNYISFWSKRLGLHEEYEFLFRHA